MVLGTGHQAEYGHYTRDVAQFGSAPDLGSGGRRFESCRPDQRLIPAAESWIQMIKGCRQAARQRFLGPSFVGSNPATPARKKRFVDSNRFFLYQAFLPHCKGLDKTIGKPIEEILI